MFHKSLKMKKIFTFIIALGVSSGIQSFAQNVSVWKEDFESVTTPALPAEWTQDNVDPIGWTTHSGSISFPPNGLGPFPAHTKYAVIDDWNNKEDNTSTMLITPYLDLTGKTGVFLQFEYFFHEGRYTSGSPVESAYIHVSSDSGENWTVVDSLRGVAAWSPKYVNLAPIENKKDVLIAFEYRDGSVSTRPLFGLAIDDIEVIIPPANEAELTVVTPEVGSFREYGEKGKTLPLGGTIYNNGGTTITSFKVHMQQSSNPEVVDVISGVHIAPFTSSDFTAPTALAVPSALGEYPVKMWIELTGDADHSNDSGSTTITSVDFKPAKKILVEEATGTWCGWCPRGTVYMDSVWHTYPNNFSLVAVHNNDPMADATYDSFLGTLFSGYPSIVVDRRQELDPSQLIEVYNSQREHFAFAELTLESPDAPSFNVKVKATVKPALNLNGEYRLAVAITEDDVQGEGSDWEQANYYSSNLPLKGAGMDWYTAPQKVAGLKYDFVGRMIYPSPQGKAGSLPATMTAGTSYDHTFEFEVPQPYKRPLRAVVMLIRSADGYVLNSNNITLTTGVSNLDAGITKMSVYPNPATSNAFVSFNLKESANVTVNVTDVMGRVINTLPAQQLNAGAHKLNISADNIPAGIYNVTLNTEKGTISERLTVTK